MIGKKMEQAINKQINEELYSAYLYLSMSAQFEAMNLGGFAHWMRVQWQEEIEHATKFMHHLYDRGGRVKLAAIDEPKIEWDSPLAMFKDALKHEQKITSLIHALADQADKEKDRAAALLLQWYVDEQVEEEKNADAIVQQLKMIGDSPAPLYMLDGRLGQRKGGD